MNTQEQHDRRLENMDKGLEEYQKGIKNLKVTLKDTDLLSSLPFGRWFAAGQYSIHGSKLSRLHRLGLLQRRPCQTSGMARTWDWLRKR